MTDSQRARLSMLQAVLAVLDQHAALFATNPALTADRARLADLVADLDPTADAQQQAARDQKPGAVKKQVKNNLALLAGETAAALLVLADDRADISLHTAADYTERSLRRQPDNDLLRLAKNIHSLATEHLPALQEQGVTEGELATLGTAIGTFQQEQSTPRVVRATTKAAFAGLATDLREAYHLVRNRLDKYLVRYQRPQPAFYTAYQSARQTINTAARPTKAPAAATA